MPRAARKARRRGESGAATIWAAAWLMALASIGEVGLVLGFAESRQHQVDAAADLTSLSAASRMQRGGDPCEAALRVAAANEVVLTGCRVHDGDVIVAVRADVDLPFGLHPWVTASSRAGPA